MFWLQAALPLRNLDFWLPALSVGLVVLTWSATRSSKTTSDQGKPSWRLEHPAALLISGTLIAIGLTRYSGAVCCLTATRPPPIWQILLAVVLWSGLVWLVSRPKLRRGWIAGSLIVLLLALLVVLKTPLSQPESQRSAAQSQRPIHPAGCCLRLCLAGFFLPGFSPDPCPARFPGRETSGLFPGRLHQLRDFLSLLGRRPD